MKLKDYIKYSPYTLMSLCNLFEKRQYSFSSPIVYLKFIFYSLINYRIIITANKKIKLIQPEISRVQKHEKKKATKTN